MLHMVGGILLKDLSIKVIFVPFIILFFAHAQKIIIAYPP